ncbi:hypothetical protein GC163_02675 [bacterium]|nr:hypothetical protein [bacterium]
MGDRLSRFFPGDKVEIIDGPFSTFEGVVDLIDEQARQVTVQVKIFGQPTPVIVSAAQIRLS